MHANDDLDPVERYLDVLRPIGDPISLAMRNVAKRESVHVTSADELALLTVLARGHQARHVLEIGTGIGLRTLAITQALGPESLVTSLEPDPELQAQAHEFLERTHVIPALELRLGIAHPLTELDADITSQDHPAPPIDLLVMDPHTLDPHLMLDRLMPLLASGAVIVVTDALLGDAAAIGAATEHWTQQQIDDARALNRRLMSDARLHEQVILRIGAGIALATKM